MSCKIIIPNRTHENFGDSLIKLITVAGTMNSTQEAEIELDFTNARILNPFFIGGLTCLINYSRDHGKTVTLNHDMNFNIRSYLGTIKFPDTYSPNDGEEEQFIESLNDYATKTYIPVIKFSTGSSENVTSVREKILSAINKLLRNQLKFSAAELQPLAYFLGELTDNINEHSNAREGYVFAQFYPQSNYIDLCICDAGQGIYQSYLNNANFDPKPKSEVEAIQLAVTGWSTKDRPEKRGFGITTTRKMLTHGLKGKIFIWSGNGSFLQTIDREVVLTLESFFQGTFIAIRLPTIIPGSFDFYKYV